MAKERFVELSMLSMDETVVERQSEAPYSGDFEISTNFLLRLLQTGMIFSEIDTVPYL